MNYVFGNIAALSFLGNVLLLQSADIKSFIFDMSVVCFCFMLRLFNLAIKDILTGVLYSEFCVSFMQSYFVANQMSL